MNTRVRMRARVCVQTHRQTERTIERSNGLTIGMLSERANERFVTR